MEFKSQTSWDIWAAGTNEHYPMPWSPFQSTATVHSCCSSTQCFALELGIYWVAPCGAGEAAHFNIEGESIWAPSKTILLKKFVLKTHLSSFQKDLYLPIGFKWDLQSKFKKMLRKILNENEAHCSIHCPWFNYILTLYKSGKARYTT